MKLQAVVLMGFPSPAGLNIFPELLERRSFKTQIEARMAVFDFIEGWYNPHRRHSALNYLSPCQFERVHRDQNVRSSTALRSAEPPKGTASGALHGAAVSDPKPTTLSGPPSAEDMQGEAEKLISDDATINSWTRPNR